MKMTKKRVQEEIDYSIDTWLSGKYRDNILKYIPNGKDIGYIISLYRDRGHDLTWFDKNYPDEMNFSPITITSDDFDNADDETKIKWARVWSIEVVLIEMYSEL